MIVRLGESVCDPGFVGPLTPEESLICNLQAGISYRDTLLAQQTAPPVSAGFGSGNMWLWVVLAVIALALLRR